MIVYLVLAHFFAVAYGQTIKAPIGDIQGKIVNYEGTSVYQFLGIPYAESPVGDLMLEKPEPKKPWNIPYDAKQYGVSCPQMSPPYGVGNIPNTRQDLDCLLLNIYVPSRISPPPQPSRSVMIFIHGGAYLYEQGMRYDGSPLAVTGDVIVVTINYRLDAFGFMSTGDGVIPGNLGLLDQRQAMIWVQDNIHAFGGDNNSITIFGESAGSYGIGSHLLSSYNNGLFHRAICQSGVALSALGMAFDPEAYTEKFSEVLKCTVMNEDGILNSTALKLCFKGKNISEILEASVVSRKFVVLAYRRVIGPVVDGDFLKDVPMNSIKRVDVPFRNVDLMIGTNNAEGGQGLGPLRSFQKDLNFNLTDGLPRRVFINLIAPAIVRDYYNSSAEVLNKIIKMYSSEEISDEDQAKKFVDVFGDFIQHAPSIDTLRKHSNLADGKSNTYQYYFTHDPETTTLYPWFQGANHADELAFVFGPKKIYPPGTKASVAEMTFSRQIMMYWTNFAKYRNPNGPSGDEWKQFSEKNPYYMKLDFTSTSHINLLSERVKFWLGINDAKPTEATVTSGGNSVSNRYVKLCFILYVSISLLEHYVPLL